MSDVHRDFFLGYCDKTGVDGYPRIAEVTSVDTTSTGWVEAHNQRRLKYHTQYKVPYVPVVWDGELYADAQAWADELVSRDGCEIGTLRGRVKVLSPIIILSSSLFLPVFFFFTIQLMF